MWPFKKKRAPRENPAANAITGNFELSAQLAGSSGRTLRVSGYVYDGESKESLEGRLDILQEVIERQRARTEIPELEAKLDQMMKGMSQARDVLTELETRQKAGQALSSQEKLNVQNLRTSINQVKEEIEKGHKAIAEAKRKAGVG